MNKKRKWIRWISLFVFIMAAAVGTKTMCYAKTYTIKTSSKPNKKTIKKLKKAKSIRPRPDSITPYSIIWTNFLKKAVL